MVLHRRNQHFVARLQSRPQEGVRDEIDGLGRAADEDDFVRLAAQELRNLLALEEGAPGDVIRLRNNSSFKEIRGKIINGRTVQLSL